MNTAGYIMSYRRRFCRPGTGKGEKVTGYGFLEENNLPVSLPVVSFVNQEIMFIDEDRFGCETEDILDGIGTELCNAG